MMNKYKVISLGSRCPLAESLKFTDLREPSPFDWCYTESSIIELSYILSGTFTKDFLNRRWINTLAKGHWLDDFDDYIIPKMGQYEFYHENLNNELIYRKVLRRVLKLQDYLDHIQGVNVHKGPTAEEYDNTYLVYLLPENIYSNGIDLELNNTFYVLNLYKVKDKLILIGDSQELTNLLKDHFNNYIYIKDLHRYYEYKSDNDFITNLRSSVYTSIINKINDIKAVIKTAKP